MDELCPACLKMGSNRKIKAIQINLEEAVWLCENEECPWPFGHEEPSFLRRRVGDKWAFEWQTYRQVQRSVGSIPVSTELSLYTPPVTPSSETITKETAKTDLAGGTNISDIPSNIDHAQDFQIHFSSNLLSFTVYDSESNNERGYEVHQKIDKSSANYVPLLSTKVSNPGAKTKSVTSIFDIDNDDLRIDTNSSKPLCSDSSLTESTVQRSCMSVPHEGKKSEETTDCDRFDAVLIESLNSATLEKNSHEIEGIVQKNSITKGVPQVRSIATANIDLKQFDNEKPTIIGNNKKDLLENVTLTSESPINGETVSPLRQKREQDIGNRLQTPRHHTTTINVNGILPITLSYDIADLMDGGAPVTSTPIEQKSKRQYDDDEKTLEASIELPKKLARLSSKRRAVKSKQYEKFNFKSLKKVTQDAADTNDVKIVDNKNIEDVGISNLNSRLDNNCVTNCHNDPNKSTTITESIAPLSANDESLTLLNISQSNSILNSEHCLPVENFNLSLLDDMLLDGYQNTTQNLNDDWLESFFT